MYTIITTFNRSNKTFFAAAVICHFSTFLYQLLFIIFNSRDGSKIVPVDRPELA